MKVYRPRARYPLLSCASAIALHFALTGAAEAAPAPTPQSPATATPGSSESQQSSKVSEVVVTATRVVRKDFTAPTPTVVVSSADIDKIAAVDVGDIAAQVPAFVATSTPATSTLSSDTGRGNFLDLRALGPNRTLVLVDGQRFVPTTVNGLVNTDVIPEGIIGHVDVVTGGASASWGSDAVAGVVNIVLNHNLNGLQGEFQGGASQYGDNASYKAALAWGSDFGGGKGHFEIAGEASANYGILSADDRPWSAKHWGDVPTPQFSLNTVPNMRLLIATNGGLILSGPDAFMEFGPGGSLQPFKFGSVIGTNGLTMQGGDGSTFAPYTALEEPQTRQNVFSRISYDVSPSVTAFVDLSYAHAATRLNNFLPNFDLVDTIFTTNAFLPPAIAAAYNSAGVPAFALGRVDTDFGNVQSIDDNQVARVVAGLDGTIGSKWTWNAYYEFGWTQHDNSIHNIVNTGNYANALNSVVNPATGNPICASTLTSPNNGCVPINIFGSGAPSPAALKYVLGTESTANYITQNVFAASIQGEPFSTWAGPVSLAAGAEFRRDTARTNVDPVQEAGGWLFGNSKSFSGSENVGEGFVETVIPLLSNLPAVKSFDVDLAARATDYSISGYVTTWKAGLTYTVNDELRIRAMQSRDIRAPNLDELFATSSLNFVGITNPTTGQTSVVPNPSPPNPKLKPEQADTTTAGIILQPHWIPGLSLSVDYYSITMHQVISSFNAQVIVNKCFAGETSFCSLVETNAAGAITQVSTPLLNVDQFYTDGVDIEMEEHLPLSRVRPTWDGNLSLRLLTTYVANLRTTDVTTVDEAGAVGSMLLPNNIGGGQFQGLPHWRGNISATYENGPATIYLEERFVGSAKLDTTYGPGVVPNNNVPAVFYTDASVQYKILDRNNRQIVLYGNVNDLFNQAPPLVLSLEGFPIASLPTNPMIYDMIGRTFILGVRFKY